MFIFRMTPRWNRSEASLETDGKRVPGIYLKFPVSVGLDSFEFDDIPDAVAVDNVSYLSVNPGIDVEIPVNDTWDLRPYASIGYGQVLGESDSAWTYWGGIKSRVSLKAGKLNWRIINQIGFVGYSPSSGPSDAIWPVMAGLEFDYPLGGERTKGGPLLHWHSTYTLFGDDVDFSASPTVIRPISDQWEIGIAYSKQDAPIRIWFLKFDRLGLGYRSSSNGDLKGVTFVFRSLFDE